METRGYRSEKRVAKARRTRSAILEAARDLVAGGLTGSPSLGAVAARAGVSRLTVYSHFDSKQGLLDALAAEARDADGRPDRAPDSGDPKQGLERLLAEACGHWASDPSLFRRLPPLALHSGGEASNDRRLAERLAAADELRAGCSIKEAEDVIALLTSFPTFDRLHQDGRRSAVAVAGILMRLAAAILA
jgi:AcrR family transcriptional regulator